VTSLNKVCFVGFPVQVTSLEQLAFGMAACFDGAPTNQIFFSDKAEEIG
jgi:hypothetical protein